MLQHGDRPTFPTVRGIDVDREGEVIPLDKFLIVGSISDLDDDSVLLSRSLAASIGAAMGVTVEVFTPLMLEKLKEDEVLLPRELQVAGIYETGWADFDKSTMVSTLRLMQELYKLEGGAHGVSVRLHPGADEESVAARLEEGLSPPNRALTWLDMYEDWLWVLELEKNMMFVLLIPVVVVAAFAIGIAQLLIVIRKTREIGLLGAIGGRPRQLVACFCFQGLLIGISGCILGVALAMVFLYFRNDIVYLFATLTGSQDVLIKFYQFADLPVKVSARDLTVIILCSLAMMIAASLIPAWWASRMKPADALRNE
jgi:lipoprotein-releasing system permease protein